MLQKETRSAKSASSLSETSHSRNISNYPQIWPTVAVVPFVNHDLHLVTGAMIDYRQNPAKWPAVDSHHSVQQHLKGGDGDVTRKLEYQHTFPAIRLNNSSAMTINAPRQGFAISLGRKQGIHAPCATSAFQARLDLRFVVNPALELPHDPGSP